MAHEFSSGVSTNGQVSWHGLETVVAGNLSAREAFKIAKADWRVFSTPIASTTGDCGVIPGYQQLTRSDNGAHLAVHSDTYRIIQNEELIRVAEAFEAYSKISAVCVLRDGARVTFCSEITDATAEVLPGDTVRCYLVGITSHDGKVAFQVLFSPVRVVCNNTMSQAIGIADRGSASHRIKIRHTLNAESLIRQIPQLIDVQTRQFKGGVEELRAMAVKPCKMAEFRDYVSAVFSDQLKGTINDKRGDDSTARAKTLEDLPLWEMVSRKFEGAAIGSSIPGVEGTVWQAYNSITEFLSHDVGKSRDKMKAAADRMEALYWGKSADLLTTAHNLALAATRS